MDDTDLDEKVRRHLEHNPVISDDLFRQQIEALVKQVEKSRRVRERFTASPVPETLARSPSGSPTPADYQNTRRRLERFYLKYMPQKVDAVETMLETYYNDVEGMFDMLVKQHGPEPSPFETLANPLQKRGRSGTTRFRDKYGFLVEDETLHRKVQEHYARAERQEGRAEVGRQVRAALEDGDSALAAALQPGRPLHDLVSRWGLPDDLRPTVWSIVSGAKEERARHPDTFYTSRCEVAVETSSLHIEGIQKDMNRTFPNCLLFEEGSVTWTKLYRVLCTHCIDNPEGYCQGMNYLAAVLLLLAPEEETFWILGQLVSSPKYNKDYYTMSMEGCAVDQNVLNSLVECSKPEVYKKLSSLCMTLGNITLRWLLCIFVDALPVESVFHIWDMYFIHGAPFSLKMCLALIQSVEGRILEAEDVSSVVLLFREATTRLVGVEVVIEQALQIDLSIERLEATRKLEREALVLERREEERKRQELRLRREARDRQLQETTQKETKRSDPRSVMRSILNLKGQQKVPPEDGQGGKRKRFGRW